MKKLILLIVFGLSCLFVRAQHYTPHFSTEKSSFVYMGVGILPTFHKDEATLVVPPSVIGYENRISERLSLGLRTGYSSSQVDYLRKDSYFNDVYFVSARLGAHCTLYKHIDIYGGAALGVYHSDLRSANPENAVPYQVQRAHEYNGATHFTWMAYVGVKRNLCKHLYAYGELSYGISIATLGIGLKL